MGNSIYGYCKKNILGIISIFLLISSLSFVFTDNPISDKDGDQDGVLDIYDLCPNSMHWERIDKNGCDPFQFCKSFNCGLGCFNADFREDELNKSMPNDCTVVILAKEGSYYPKCVPVECKKQPIVPNINVTVRLNKLNSGSYFKVNITGLPDDNSTYPIINGIYPGWCADEDHGTNRSAIYTARLYSSLDPNLTTKCPRCYDPDWDMVNYILNHKKGDMLDIQAAIHYFIDHGVYPSDPDAIAMVEEALAHGEGFWPQEGEYIAIIVDIGTRVQLLFIEIDP